MASLSIHPQCPGWTPASGKVWGIFRFPLLPSAQLRPRTPHLSPNSLIWELRPSPILLAFTPDCPSPGKRPGLAQFPLMPSGEGLSQPQTARVRIRHAPLLVSLSLSLLWRPPPPPPRTRLPITPYFREESRWIFTCSESERGKWVLITHHPCRRGPALELAGATVALVKWGS